jgi:hypothetical protein
LPPASLPPLNPIQCKRFGYREIEAAMAYAEQVTREPRRALDRLLGDTAHGHAASLSPEDASVCKTAAVRAGTTNQPKRGDVTPAA